MHVGFIGLGNVGGLTLTVRDLDRANAETLVAQGANFGDSASVMARDCDVIITCLPSPEASAAVLEGADGVLEGMTPGTIWAEMSTTDELEVKRLGEKVHVKGGFAAVVYCTPVCLDLLPF